MVDSRLYDVYQLAELEVGCDDCVDLFLLDVAHLHEQLLHLLDLCLLLAVSLHSSPFAIEKKS